MCAFYANEGERRKHICSLFREYGIETHPGPIGSSNYATDGHVLHGRHPTFILELKNEIGAKGAEPSLQALLYYDKFARESDLATDATTCHPCFIAFLAGEFLHFWVYL
jgi:hypothetical protein